jgi:MFS family permease
MVLVMLLPIAVRTGYDRHHGAAAGGRAIMGHSRRPQRLAPVTDAKPALFRWMEPWFSAYGLVGMLVLGVGPILIPVTVDAAHGDATAVGLVVAAFYVGGIVAPLIGDFADRTGRQRLLFLAGYPVMAAAALGFGLADRVALWVFFALIAGAAGAATGSIAGLFIVESHPQAEWNNRIGWFQLAYGSGQVLGLVIAAAAVNHLRLGWVLTALLMLAGAALGRIGLPRLPAAAPKASSNRSTAVGLRRALGSSFGLLLLTWLLTMTGVQTFFNVVPLVMKAAFDVSASASSLLFLVGAAIGTLAYPLCGRTADRFGAGPLLGAGLILVIAAFGAMSVASITHPGGRAVVGAIGLVVAAVAYSFLVVATTMLVTRLTPWSEGSAIGLVYGLIAAGAVIGAIVPSFVAKAFGYDALPALAAGILIVALVVGLPLLRVSSGTGRSTG